jgi:hypothetical protein
VKGNILYAEEEEAMIERKRDLASDRWSEPDDDGGARWMDFWYIWNEYCSRNKLHTRYCPSAESGQPASVSRVCSSSSTVYNNHTGLYYIIRLSFAFSGTLMKFLTLALALRSVQYNILYSMIV